MLPRWQFYCWPGSEASTCHVIVQCGMEIWAMCMYMYMWDVCNTLETLHIIICWTSRYTMRNSLVPRPPCPAFVSCSTKNGGRPGRIYHVMHAAADVTFSLLTSEFVLSPSLFFPWIQFVLSFQFVLRVRFLLDWLWLATVRDVSSGMHHVINPSRPSPPLFYCKQQKLGVEAWERG